MLSTKDFQNNGTYRLCNRLLLNCKYALMIAILLSLLTVIKSTQCEKQQQDSAWGQSVDIDTEYITAGNGPLESGLVKGH